MKKGILIYVIAFVSIFFLFFYLARSCKITDKYSRLKGEYDALQKILESDKEIADKIIKENEKKIAELNGMIDSSNTEISKREEVIEARNAKIKKLEAAYPQLKTKEELIENLSDQLEEWKAKFNLVQEELVEKDKIIFALTEKYESAIKISEQYKNLYDDENKLRLVCDKKVSVLEGKVTGLRFGSRVRNVLIAGLAGYLAFTAISK